MLVLLLLLAASAGAMPAPPSRLLADFVPSPALGVARQPLLSFGLSAGPRGLAVGWRRVLLYNQTGPVWDSGQIVTAAAAIRCGRLLEPGAEYRWTAQWQPVGGRPSEMSREARLVVGLFEEQHWRGARWLGAGHTHFRTMVQLARPERLRLFVASPGGFVARINSRPGPDQLGVSGWWDWTGTVPASTVELEAAAGPNRLEVEVGCGAWCPSQVPTWEHSGRAIATSAGAMPAARLLLVLSNGTAIPSGDLFSSRYGAVRNTSSWLGSSVDWTLPDGEGWALPARRVPDSTVRLDLPPAVSLALPPMRSFEPEPARSVARVAGGWVYDFGGMIVGNAAIASGAWAGRGQLLLEYCEALLNASACLRQQGYERTGVVERHIVSSANHSQQLQASLSWRGFQFVLVKLVGEVTFNGRLADLTARWSGASIEPAASLNFSGGSESVVLNKLEQLVKRSFRSNLISGLPTDCPTREKHGWLGDAMDIAFGAMQAFWVPTLMRAFVGQIGLAQDNTTGFVPVVVPCHKGVDLTQNDLSWTAAFVLIPSWLDLHYGDRSIVEAHWPGLKLWIDAQIRNATSRPAGLPDFAIYGDESALDRSNSSHVLVGQQCSASNFLVALQAGVGMATQLGRSDDARRWLQTLNRFQAAYDQRFWSPQTASFSATAMSRQTIDALGVAAGAGTVEHRRLAAATVLQDVVARNYSLTVGSVGQKRLLTTLSQHSDAGHEAALRLATSTRFPGYGYWLEQGASTCWESWTTMDQPTMDHFHGSRNHAWLCGGLAEWLYSSLGGIKPLASGYSKVLMQPRISQEEGPSSVAMSVQTIRGTIAMHWRRGSKESELLQLTISIPPGVTAYLNIPLLTPHTARTYVNESGKVLWEKSKTYPIDGVQHVEFEPQSPETLPVLSMQLSSGEFMFAVTLTL